MENSEVKNITKRFENNFRELKKNMKDIKVIGNIHDNRNML